MAFLSQENATFIMNFLQGFMLDKYSFDIQKNVPEKEYLQMVGMVMTKTFRSHGNQHGIGELNKMVLSELKESLKEKISLHSANANASLHSSSPYVPEVNVPIPEGEDEADNFFHKLQKLEFQRKSGAVITPPLPADIKPAEQTTVMASPMTSSSVVPNTIFVPSPPRVGRELHIHSWGRDWTHDEHRNGFQWKGPLPRQMDRTNTRVGCLIGSTDLLRESSLLSLRIEGANQDEACVSLIPSHTVGGYTIFRPVLESLSYLRLLALPWRIYIEASDGEMIHLGRDNIPYQVSPIQSGKGNGNTRLITSLFEIEKNTRVGDSLRLYLHGSKKIISTKICSVFENEVEVSGNILEHGSLLHFNSQFSIVFELVSTEHKVV